MTAHTKLAASSSVTTTVASSAAPAGIIPDGAPAAPVVLSTAAGMVLTVGAGGEFATLGAALRNAVNGDTIAVKAGTYVNDFGVVNAKVTIVAVGGMVNEVGTTPPPNGKGILTVDNDLTIRGFSFTGAATGDMYGNVAGIRDEAGNLNIAYCNFHDLQDGLLVTPNVSNTGSVSIDHSEFSHDGTGDGYTHDIYVGDVASFTLTNSYIHDAVVGHEVKSRAAVTTISHNVIADGPTGTGSYDIDIPNAGVATITDNIIEKGPNASNIFAIHYGGEGQYSYAENSLTVTGNTIIDDLPGQTGYAVANQSAYNGLNVSANLFDNHLYGFAPGNVILNGLGSETNDTVLTTAPAVPVSTPWAALPPTVVTGPERLSMVTQNQTVAGGSSQLIVNDGVGSNEIDGGAGGLVAFVAGQYEKVTTQAGAADTVNAAGGNATVVSAGSDLILASGNYSEIDATGQATIVGSAYETFNLDGAGEVLRASSSALVNVGAAGNARVVDRAGDLKFSVFNGGVAVLVDSATRSVTGTSSVATVSGGAATGWITNAGAISITTGDGGASVQAGLGTVSITGGAGNDSLSAGIGSGLFTLGSGTDVVTFGRGTAQVTGGTGADTYVFRNSDAGADTITCFKQGVDSLQFTGFAGNPIASGTVVDGSTLLTLSNGTTVDVAGVTLPGYGGSAPAGPGGGNPGGGPTVGGGTNPTPVPSSSNGTLTSTGQSVSGGSSLLTVTDAAGGNTIAGGAGGIAVSAAPGDLITTAAGAADTVSLASYDTLNGLGSDQVTVSASHNVIMEAGLATVSVAGANNLVQGGAGLLQVSDQVSGNTIVGGAGGMIANLGAAYDVISTAQGASDTVSLNTQDTLASAGQDQIAVTGLYNQISASGVAVINSTSNYSSYDLEGRDSLITSGGGAVTVGGAATDIVASTGDGGIGIVKMAGGSASVSQAMAGGDAAATISGGAATVLESGGQYAGIFVNTAGGASVTAGGGAVTVTSTIAAGAPADTIDAGAGSLTVNTNGAVQVFGAGGSLVVNATQEAAGVSGVSLAAGSGNVTLNGGNGNEQFTAGSGQAQVWPRQRQRHSYLRDRP